MSRVLERRIVGIVFPLELVRLMRPGFTPAGLEAAEVLLLLSAEDESMEMDLLGGPRLFRLGGVAVS